MPIYLDNNATTALDPQVINAMLEELSCGPSNPSSIHSFGQAAKKKLVKARHFIASFFSTVPEEIFFTSGGTEGLNFLIHFFTAALKNGHIITSASEHPSMIRPIQTLEKKGFDVTYLEPGLFGSPMPHAVVSALRPDTCLIALSGANSETGVLLDIEEIAKNIDVPLVIDGVGLLGKEIFSIPQGVSAMAFSAHKIHGPKGVGFVFLRKGFKGESLLKGGGQEYGFRSGTENLAGIIGLAKALECIDANAIKKMRHLRDLFERILLSSPHGIEINGKGPRISNTSNLYIPFMDGESLLIQLDLLGIAASHGSACSSGGLEPSKILQSMGYSPQRARHSLRFSFSRFNTEEEVLLTTKVLLDLLQN